MAYPQILDATLVKSACHVNGIWHFWPEVPRQDVLNPSDRTKIAEVPLAVYDQASFAIDAAQAALADWRGRLATERAEILSRWDQLIRAHADTLAAIVTPEQGKPLREAKGEVIYGADFFRLAADEATHQHGRLFDRRARASRVMETRAPIGVVGAITPWNFPSVMVSRKIAPALAAGCTMVLKPAPETPLFALALVHLGEIAGLPPGGLNIITGGAPEIGRAMMDRSEVRMITFTGSAATGRLLAAKAARTIKRTTLELGGTAPFLLRCRSGRCHATDAPEPGKAFRPPIAGVQVFETAAEGITLPNATEYGLTAFFFTRDLDRVFRVSEALEAGIVGANTTATSSAFLPFGGVKQSGLGREGGAGSDARLSGNEADRSGAQGLTHGTLQP